MNIREMNLSDIDFAFSCTQSEGWISETKEDFKGFLEYDSHGCFIAEVKSNRIGMCVATAYRENGFIGELITIKEMRGRGYGSLLFDYSVRYLLAKGIKNIYLDGDLDAVTIYEKAGFRKINKSLRFVGKIPGKYHNFVRKVQPEDINTICEIDKELFGDNRGFFLKRRMTLYPDYCFVLDIANKIEGYIMARPGSSVVSVGPWIMLKPEKKPDILLARLTLETGEHILRIGILESNKKAVNIIKSLQTFEEKVFCWRMVLGPQENLGMNQNLLATGTAAKG